MYVAGDNFFYHEEGNPRAVISPDVYVVRGVPKHLRRMSSCGRKAGACRCS